MAGALHPVARGRSKSTFAAVPLGGHQRAGDNTVVESADIRQTAMLLYERLRALARARIAGERFGHTLDATGLANEAILRLLNCDPSRINDEQHFMALAADAMRRVLVDHARKKQAEKRGGGFRPDQLDTQSTAALRLRAEPETVLSLNEALGALEQADAQTATIVKLRAFAGMDCDEIAALLGLSRRSVERRWRFAMADLRTRLTH